MNLAPFIPLAGSVCNILFALFVFSRTPRARANQVYLLLGLSIATWNLGSYFLFVVDDRETALIWARFLQMGVIFAFVGFIQLSLLVCNVKIGRNILWLYGFQILLAILNLTPLYVSDVRFLGTAGWYAVAGPAFHLINVPYALSVGAIIMLLLRRRQLPPLQRKRLTPLICAQMLLALLGINDLLPILGIDRYPLSAVHVYPYGSLAAVFYGIIVAYSVMQHHLLDIHIGLSRFAAHIVRFAFLFSIALGLLLAASAFTGSFNTVSFVCALAAYAASTIMASILFPRVFGAAGLEKWERRILGDRFEYQDQVRSFVESMAWYNDLQTLLDDLHEVFTVTFRLESYQIILRDETTRVFSRFRSHPEQPLDQLPEIRVPSPVFQFFEWGKGEYLSLGSTSLRSSDSALERNAREQLTEFGAEFCFPMASQNEPFGLILVGRKQTGDPYTATDINLLVTLVKSMSLMVNQIRLKTQILQNQELDLLGRMSRGMAHDLNNLLTPVWTLLQLASEEEDGNTFDEELLPVALRNIKTMRAYIREALFFSENLRPDFQLGRLDMLIVQASELAKASRPKQMEVVAESPGEILAEVDEVLLQRMLANLISNAIDASTEGSEVRVELTRLAKTEANRDWVRVQIRDSGEGIRKEDLNRVFTPYFTTKNRGDQTRGFGLGLAICRKIVNLHGGNLSITSQLRKGTTVQVDIPTRQIKQVQPDFATSA